jgi:hypothetical protein
VSDRDVFINCPFTSDYQTFFRAIVFTILRSGFQPRCALEVTDSGEVRFEKICRIIRESPFGVHDISMTELDSATGLPRFNMPLELGLFLGASRFGATRQRSKVALILDRERYRYQAFMSDIAGQDIQPHGGDLATLITIVATWLREVRRDPLVPGGRAIAAEFERFDDLIPGICGVRRLSPEELTFTDFRLMAAEWILSDDRDRVG